MSDVTQVGNAPRCVGDWVLSSQIGQGSFAQVYKSLHKSTGRPAAVKEINLSKLNNKLRQSLESEIAILKRIDHHNIVKLYEVIQEAGRLYLVMEYCAGGDLSQLLRRVKKVPESTARLLLQQLARGMKAMWSHHLVHRDLKPQNLLLSASDPSSTLKIADFGFARNLQPQGLAETLCGSPLYMAPEILQLQRYDAKADLWSVGAILFELVAGRPPFTGANQFALLRAIEKSEAKLPEDIAATLSPSCIHLLHCLLRKNPVERISFEEFFAHEFLNPANDEAQPSSSTAAADIAGRNKIGEGLRASRSVGSFPQHIVGFPNSTTNTSKPATTVHAAAVLPAGQLTSQLKPRRGSFDHLDHARRQLLTNTATADNNAKGHFPQQQQQQKPKGGTSPLVSFAVVTPALQPPSTAPSSLPPNTKYHSDDTSDREKRNVLNIQQQADEYDEDVQSYVLVDFPGRTTQIIEQQQQHAEPLNRRKEDLRQRQQQAMASSSSGQQGMVSVVASSSSSKPAEASKQQEEEEEVQVEQVHRHYQDIDYGFDNEQQPFLFGPSSSSNSMMMETSQPRVVASQSSGPIIMSNSSNQHNNQQLDEEYSSLAVAAAAMVPWQATGHRQFLCLVGGILSSLANEALPLQNDLLLQYQSGDAVHTSAVDAAAKALALDLAALQLFDLATTSSNNSSNKEREAADVYCSIHSDGSDGGVLLDLTEATERTLKHADAAAAVLKELSLESSPLSREQVDIQQALPHPWETSRLAAIQWAEDAAADELLGNYARAEDLYAKAGAVLHFLVSEAPGLKLWPNARQGEAAVDEEKKLRVCAAAAAGRWAACAALEKAQQEEEEIFHE